MWLWNIVKLYESKKAPYGALYHVWFQNKSKLYESKNMYLHRNKCSMPSNIPRLVFFKSSKVNVMFLFIILSPPWLRPAAEAYETVWTISQSLPNLHAYLLHVLWVVGCLFTWSSGAAQSPRISIVRYTTSDATEICPQRLSNPVLSIWMCHKSTRNVTSDSIFWENWKTWKWTVLSWLYFTQALFSLCYLSVFHHGSAIAQMGT